MKTLETYTTWTGLLYLFAIVLLVYWAIKIIAFLIERVGKKNHVNRKLEGFLRKLLVIYPLLAAIILLLGFVSVNYLAHGIVVIVLGSFGYSYIRNYLSGIFLKLNPIVSIGAQIKGSDFDGEINKFLPLGMIVNTEAGERFVGYTGIENRGFTVNSNKNADLRQTLYLKSEYSKDRILDILFENPILDFNETPEIKEAAENMYALKYTMENGVTSEDLVAFLQGQNIEVNKTYKP